MSNFLAMMPGHGVMRSRFERACHDPVSASLIAVSTAVSAAGAIQQGQAQKKSYQSQETADLYNASVAGQNAAMAGQAGTSREVQTRTNNAMQLGQERAAVGAANIGGPGGGTIATTLNQDNVNAELNSLGVRYQTDTAMAGYQDEQQQDNYQGQVAKENAHSASTAGYMGAVGDIFKGATAAYMTSTPSPSAQQVYGSGSFVGPSNLPWQNSPGYSVPYTSREF